ELALERAEMDESSFDLPLVVALRQRLGLLLQLAEGEPGVADDPDDLGVKSVLVHLQGERLLFAHKLPPMGITNGIRTERKAAASRRVGQAGTLGAWKDTTSTRTASMTRTPATPASWASRSRA